MVNNSLPGPAIEVYEGQKVKVMVTNLLLSEGKCEKRKLFQVAAIRAVFIYSPLDEAWIHV